MTSLKNDISIFDFEKKFRKYYLSKTIFKVLDY